MTDDARPRLALALPDARGLARFASTYLVSAFCVLLGGWLTLYGERGQPRNFDLAHVLGTQLLYAAALAGAIALLAKRASCRRDLVLLLPLLLVFSMDGLLVQHLYGWFEPEGIVAATVGVVVAGALLLLVARRLRLPLLSPLVVTPLVAAVVVRLGPFLLTGVAETPPLVPRQVALGWLAALTLLPAIALRPAADRRARGPAEHLPLRRLELGAVGLSLAFTLLHFIPSGSSFDLPFRLAYLAPFLVLGAPALDQLFPVTTRRRPLSTLSRLLPLLGVALAATQLTPGLGLTDWTVSWPLTPFWIALVVAALVEAERALTKRDSAHLHVAAGLAVLACLGGDFPEVLVTTVHPAAWQAMAAAALTLPVLWAARQRREGLLLHALTAWIAASSLHSAGYPRILGWIVLLTWGAALLHLLQPNEGERRDRLATALVLTALPVGHALLAEWSVVTVVVAVASCSFAAAVGLAARDPLLQVVGPACGGLGLLLLPLRLQVDAGVPVGILFVELGFVLLLAGLASSLAGERIAARVTEWWRRVGTAPDAGEL